MKIDTGEHGELILSEVYLGIGIKTDAGIFRICQRDGGLEMRLDYGKWFAWKTDAGPAPLVHLAEKKSVLCKNKPTLEELEGILNSNEEVPIQILPNGEITTRP